MVGNEGIVGPIPNIRIWGEFWLFAPLFGCGRHVLTEVNASRVKRRGNHWDQQFDRGQRIRFGGSRPDVKRVATDGNHGVALDDTVRCRVSILESAPLHNFTLNLLILQSLPPSLSSPVALRVHIVTCSCLRGQADPLGQFWSLGGASLRIDVLHLSWIPITNYYSTSFEHACTPSQVPL